jgi:hypothetical protein
MATESVDWILSGPWPEEEDGGGIFAHLSLY